MISPKSAVKEKKEYSKTAGTAFIGSALSENCKFIKQFYALEQLFTVSECVHGYKYVD